MRTKDWLVKATDQLTKAGITTARLDVLVLLEDATHKDRSWLLAHPETVLQGGTLQDLDLRIERRKSHEPLSYIRSKSEFYGREFNVNSHTLEPRPETETMIDLLKQFHCKVGPCNVVDVGTGSGCLAITTKLELPDINVFGTDVDSECIKIARQNARRLGAQIEFFECDLLNAISLSVFDTPTYILANLPYVPNSHTINQAAMFEPKHAIFGGPDGLDIYRKLFTQIKTFSVKPQYIVTESLPFQHENLSKIALTFSYQLKEINNFIQVFQRV